MDPVERQALHARLDELLDWRERIETNVYDNFARNLYPRLVNQDSDLEPRSVYLECVAFARTLMGPVIPWRVARRLRPHMADRRPKSDTLLDFRDWLDLNAPLLRPNGEAPEMPVAGGKGAVWRLGEWPVDMGLINSELFDLIQGSTSDLFAPALRLPGQSAKPYVLSMARLFALMLDRLYAAENSRRPSHARSTAATWRVQIAAAFGVGGWSTIEKWEGMCRRWLGDWTVETLLGAASVTAPPGPGGSDLDAATRARGAEFQQVARAVKGGDRKRRQPRQAKTPTI